MKIHGKSYGVLCFMECGSVIIQEKEDGMKV